ncbi:MAG: hypothetical protein J6Y07_00185 [Alphaproteobacteria bacterium]|nr:hypothetical protein [Alphaproteobacteria bacterium]
MKILGKNFDDKKTKKIVYTAVLGVLAVWFIYRFVMVAIESRMVVFNPGRDAGQNGIVVDIIIAEQKTGIIKTPLSVESNRAYVSGAHRRGLKVGQKIGNGKITYVGSQLDLDTGMYVIKTKDVDDGVAFAESECSGFFIPTYAVRESNVLRAESGVAVVVPVTVNTSDSDFSCVVGDIHDGDIIVLSKVGAGQKINVQK